MIRILYDELKNEFFRVLVKHKFQQEKAEQIAEIFASNSRDGVNSHGINRFPGFIEYVKEGLINKSATPSLEKRIGAIERWNGNLGAGVLNAKFCMNRAIELAKENGIGCVAINNTNHWMRGGTYGWQAAEAGVIGICFTNTIANMPPWGGTEPRLGNNPLVIGVPRKDGHIVLDMAMSQYSYGKLSEYQVQGKSLPFDGGFNDEGSLSKNPREILESKRTLPVGFWKGSGLSLMLDLLVSVLSEGKSTAEISKTDREVGVSQVFICISTDNLISSSIVEQILAYTKTSAPVADDTVLYPGENTLRSRIENLAEGVPIDETVWKSLKSM